MDYPFESIYLATTVEDKYELSHRIAYREACPHDTPKGIILLIHGFPQTSYQYRHVLALLASRCYRAIAPDYRGAGGSDMTSGQLDKATMASDMVGLLDKLGIEEEVHVVGHDIGGMIAYAMARHYPERVASLCLGECPIPGTKTYKRDIEGMERGKMQFHFFLHANVEIAVTLVTGKEREYLTHFFSKLAHNLDAFPPEAVDEYARAYSQPGALQCAFDTYDLFRCDALLNDRLFNVAKLLLEVPTQVLSGKESRHRHEAREMGEELVAPEYLRVAEVAGAGHYVAEESPEEFVKHVVGFIKEANAWVPRPWSLPETSDHSME